MESDCPQANFEKTWLTTGEDLEPEEKYDWVSDECFDYQADNGVKDRGDKTYFTLVNIMREPMKAGSQAWNSYGNRTNRYLLTHYGFAFRDNFNNSYQFYVRMNVDLRSGVGITSKQIIAPLS